MCDLDKEVPSTAMPRGGIHRILAGQRAQSFIEKSNFCLGNFRRASDSDLKVQ